MATYSVALYFALILATCVGVVLRSPSASRRRRAPHLRVRLIVGAALFLVLVPLVTPALPAVIAPWLFPTPASAGEVLTSPKYMGVTVMPDGQVGMIFQNGGTNAGDIRFKRYFTEHGADPSQQLSNSWPFYPQIASFQGKVIAAYVDTRTGSPTVGELLVRTSSDDGATWGAEFIPFGSETFDGALQAPLLVASRDGTRLYLFSCCASSLPQFRYTTDPALGTWTTAAAAGDASIATVSNNGCGNDGDECLRAHSFEFTETASGQWVYVAKSPYSYYQAGRGTQVGTLGGSWSAQVDHAGQGSRATAFVDRAGNIYFLRTDDHGTNIFLKKSTDGGLTWGPEVYAYSSPRDWYTTGSPVGLYVPGYSLGEYIWYAGFGGIGNGNIQDAARVVPLWSGPRPYYDTGTTRLFGSLGGDWDFGTAYPYTFGRRDIPTGVGAYKTAAEDLAIPGRLLNLSFSRSYDSADLATGPFGPGWTHSFNWSLLENADLVHVRRGDGRLDTFARQPDLSYTPPLNVFDTLVKNPDSSFTLTLKNQTQYEFSSGGQLTRIHEPAGNQITLGYITGKLATITDTAGRVSKLNYSGGINLALGKTYAKSVVADPAYPDTNNSELTDGTIGPAEFNGYLDPAWQGHHNLGSTPLDVTIDLSSSQTLGLVRSYFVDQGILVKPASVEILTSPDDLTYTSRGSTLAASAVNDFAQLWHYDLALSSVQARYVRFRSTAAGEWLFSSEMQVFAPGQAPLAAQPGTNSGAGKGYQRLDPDLGYPDSGGELTDGNLGDPNNYLDASWQGHHNLGSTPLDVTVDLGSAQRIGVVRSYHLHVPSQGILRPAKIELLTSTDNAQFTSRGSTVSEAAVNDSGSRWRYEYDLGGISARYVRLRITSAGEWLFSSEVQLFAEGAAPITMPLSHGERLTSLIDPIGRKLSYGYDQLGRLTRVADKIGTATGQDPTLHSWHYSYDGQTQHITRVIDPDSRTRVVNAYNSEGRLATQTDGAGNTTSFGYGTQQTTVTDPRGHVTTQNFDDRWRLSSQVDVVVDVNGTHNYTLEYLYEDPWENLTAVIDRNGKRTDYTYDDRGNVWTKTDPEVDPQIPRYVTTFTYDTRNNLKTILDARGFLTTNDYDAVTNVKLKTTQRIDSVPTDAVTKWEYADLANPGLPTKIIAPRGNTGPTPNYTYAQTLVYDAQGNLSTRTDADGDLTRFCYQDGLSRLTSMVDPDGSEACGAQTAPHTWKTFYDENDRVTEERDPLLHSSVTTYDGAGDRLTVTDRDGNVTTYAYDGAARLSSVKQKPKPIDNPTLIYTTTVTRDANGNAVQVTQDKQGDGTVTVSTDYGYDVINRLTSVTTHPGAPANLTTSYVLDGNGNTLTRTTGDNVATIYTYDALSRLKTVSSSGLPVSLGYGYDELSHRISMTDGTGTSTYVYDGLGRLTSAVQPNGTLGYGYDLDSNRTTLTYPTVGSVTYHFTNAGRLSYLLDWATPARQSIYTYYPSGLTHTVVVPGGLTTTYTYDNAQRLATLTNATASGTITSDTYSVDNEGNRTAIDEQMPAVVFPSVKVNGDTGTAVQDHPALALGNEQPSPASYLIWDDQRNGATNSDIFFSRRDPLTGTWSANAQVNSGTTTRNQANPAIAVDGANNAYAVWDDFRAGTSNQDIWSAVRSASTGSWAANLKVNDGTGNTNERNPRIAVTPAGAETAVWVDFRSSQRNIYSSSFVPGDSAWRTNKKITDNTSSTIAKDFPDVAVGADGVSYAVWEDSRNGNADIYFSSLPSGGSTWSIPNEKISDDPGTTAQTLAHIGADSSGNLIAAWVDARTTPSHVRVRRRVAGATWAGSAASLDLSPTPANVQSLSLSVRADGFAWVSWGDTRAGSTNQDIWGARYDPNTNSWTTPVRLDDDPGTSANQLSPAVAFGPAEVQLAWRDNRLSANGDIQSRKVQVLAGMSDHFVLSYDGLNRLTKISGPVPESFALDGPSNITSRTGPTQTDGYDASNRLINVDGQPYTWSNADRLTNRAADTFIYDALDRLTSSTVAGSSRTYAYNGDGLLQSRTGSGATTFLWDPATSASRELKQGTDNIVYGLGPLYVVKADASTLTFARDGSKNVRAELNASGAVTAAFRYRAYGQISQNTIPVPTYLGLASQLLDPSGLYYLRARWYDPASGRFMSRDPLTSVAGSSTYSYASGNPLLSADPTGLTTETSEDRAEGACVDDACGDGYAPYSIATILAVVSDVATNRGLDGGNFLTTLIAGAAASSGTKLIVSDPSTWRGASTADLSLAFENATRDELDQLVTNRIAAGGVLTTRSGGQVGLDLPGRGNRILFESGVDTASPKGLSNIPGVKRGPYIKISFEGRVIRVSFGFGPGGGIGGRDL